MFKTFQRITFLNRIEHQLVALLERTKTMAVDTTKLVAAVAQIQADQAKNSADIQAIIAALSAIVPNDPAVQAVIDQAVTDLGTVDANMQAANAAAESAVAPAPPAA